MRVENEMKMTREEALAYKIPRKEAWFGDKDFYIKVLSVTLPMIAQNTLTNVVGLLDNVMVGRIGTYPMSAVSIVNNLVLIFYLCIWGALAGAGIYGTQFFGKGDLEGVRSTMRMKLWTAAIITGTAFILFTVLGETLIGSYIAADTTPEAAALTMRHAKDYLRIIMVSFIPFGLCQVYSGTLRESGKTRLPMLAGMTAMVVNFIFNLLLIFGYLGFPRLGVVGAALATALSRFVELFIVVFFTHRNKQRYPFAEGLYRTILVPSKLAGKTLAKILPLLGNEFLWSAGQAMLLQCFSVRGLNVVAAMNITHTIQNVFMEVFLSMGYAVGVLCGQELGANRLVTARMTSSRMTMFSVLSSVGVAGLMIAVSPIVPHIYNTEPEIRALATTFLIIYAACMPIEAYTNAAYFTLRSGGKTLITFLFDACFVWLFSVPTAFILTRFTDLHITGVLTCVLLMGIIKCLVGHVMVSRGMWVNNIVADNLLE